MIELLRDLRFTFPRTVFFTTMAAGTSFVLWAFMALPPSPFLSAIGVPSGQARLTALYHAGFWYYRVQVHPSEVQADGVRRYGSIVGMDKEGRLIITEIRGVEFKRRAVQLADLHIQDPAAAAQVVNGVRGPATFDVYDDVQVVAWVRGEPLNLFLIDAGAAAPDPNPPTNIVDRAFAIYYWRKFYGTD